MSIAHLTRVMALTNGDSKKLLAALFSIGDGTPEIIWISASILANMRAISRSGKTRFIGVDLTTSGVDRRDTGVINRFFGYEALVWLGSFNAPRGVVGLAGMASTWTI